MSIILTHQGKNNRIAALHEQLKMPPQIPKVILPIQLQVFLKTGIDILQCPYCNSDSDRKGN